ncbi:glycoside hydrolase family 1 protein [Novosphingobium clariflavum]|uniref:Glycoside hydrolase family 1 protein n=1 Tax=Novosphingobium clariflavum TaxID=2029884 RepID=A0ABV6S920_9SPHN|nr:family 1 glycosylhydrolase [Novosphingobium clariflavum]
MMDRRTMLASGLAAGALASQSGKAMAATARSFPKGFRWGTASAAHQVEGNNTLSDLWLVEQVKPTMFMEPSGDANNSFELWPRDLDLVKALGLDTYRFSIEWARIEPRPGVFSTAMLDHYARIIDGCHARGLTPMVTFNHFTLPRWFAAQGGWTQKEAADLFARYCDKAARRLAAGMGYATTLNEPNMIHLVDKGLPPQMAGMVKAMNQAAGAACGASNFKNGMLPEHDDIPLLEANMLAAHKEGRAAIKAARGDLPVGVSLTMSDDQAVGANSQRDAIRKQFYGPWLELAKQDDFIGVQNYARAIWNAQGQVQPPADVPRSQMGVEIYPASLAGAVRYAHEATGRPVMVTEHGIGIEDDAVRAKFIPEALAGLQQAIADGVPVLGYVHWTLADNFEWVFGFKHKYGLCSVDRTTFARTPKPSAAVLGAIAKRNAV